MSQACVPFLIFGACILGGVPVVGSMFRGDFGVTSVWWRASGGGVIFSGWSDFDHWGYGHVSQGCSNVI